MSGKILRLRVQVAVILILTVLMTSGCLYPRERITGGFESIPGQIEQVQSAVDQFQADKSVLPIKTVSADTPIFQKYVIDFERLGSYMLKPPSNAFENGGHLLYVLIDVENNPTVKVFDLRVSDTLRPVQAEVFRYLQKHNRYPRGMEISPGVFHLNVDLLDEADIEIPSPYTRDIQLPLVMDSQGMVYVDYRPDLMRSLQNLDAPPPSEDFDLRYLLTERSPFVPAHSLPYKYEEGDPVFNVNP